MLVIVMSNSLQPHELYVAHLCPWDFPGKNTGVACHFLLQWIFQTQELNSCLLCLLHCRWILYLMSRQGSPQVNVTYTNVITMLFADDMI